MFSGMMPTMTTKHAKTNAGLLASKHFSGLIAKIIVLDAEICIPEWCVPTPPLILEVVRG